MTNTNFQVHEKMHLNLIRITLSYLHYNRAMPVCLMKIIDYLRADALVLFIRVDALIYLRVNNFSVILG